MLLEIDDLQDSEEDRPKESQNEVTEDAVITSGMLESSFDNYAGSISGNQAQSIPNGSALSLND